MSEALHSVRWLSPVLLCACAVGGEGISQVAGDSIASDETPPGAAGNAMALHLTIAAALVSASTAAMTFYDSPVVLDPAPALDSTCEVPTQPHEVFRTSCTQP